MTQPSFVPIVEADQVRPSYRLKTPGTWMATRPSELTATSPPEGDLFGRPGPDQGFALKLARRFESRLSLTEGEHAEDAIAGCTAIAMRRAGSLGRAPVVFDLEFAFTLYGFLGTPTDQQLAARRPLFSAASHHYQAQRRIAASVRATALKLTPAQVDEAVADGRFTELVEASEAH